MDTLERIERWWDEDAASYDGVPGHGAATPAERAAWAAALSRHLPVGGSVLDVGAGTGFLALAAARLGCRVTALDLSGRMLDRLRAAAASQGLEVATHQGPADQPPDGPFDAVMSRHLLWTLPEPERALAAWRAAAPTGRLVLLESMWGRADRAEVVRQRLRHGVDRLRRVSRGHHHDEYDPVVLAQLPYGNGIGPGALVELVEAGGWGPARLERLRDVEWARLLARPPLERLLGVTPTFVVGAG
jgi:SAM-dependent methyltransferase